MNRDILKKLVLEQMKGAAVQRIMESEDIEVKVSGHNADREDSEPTPEDMEPIAFKEVKDAFPEAVDQIGEDKMMQIVRLVTDVVSESLLEEELELDE